jgi:hypothetical protein
MASTLSDVDWSPGDRPAAVARSLDPYFPRCPMANVRARLRVRSGEKGSDNVSIFTLVFLSLLILPIVGIILASALKTLTDHREKMAQIQKQQVSSDEIIRLNVMNRLMAVPYRDSTIYLVVSPGGTMLVLVRSARGGYELLGTPEEVSRTFPKYRGLDKYIEDDEIQKLIADMTLADFSRS